MSSRVAPFVVAAVVLGAAGFALVRGEDTLATRVEAAPPPRLAPAEVSPLPPNHPPIGSGSTTHGATHPGADEAAALTWKAPSDWQSAPNPNAMRLATYRTPSSSPDAVEVSIARAGGTTEANIQRWLAQFDQAGAETRTEKTIRGMHVTVVAVAGTYEGGGTMAGTAPRGRPGWALLGAIVETAGSSYFFKMVGPAPAVRAAQASFDTLVESVTPS